MGEQLVVRNAGDGRGIWMLGGRYEVKASSSETGGAMTVLEMHMPGGMGPPPHTHSGAEAVYVIEGQLRYHIEGQTHEAGPGSFFYIPEGTLENFEPVTECRILTIYGGGQQMDNFFGEAGVPAQSMELPPPLDAPPDLEALAATAAKYGMKLEMPAQA